MPAKPQWLLKIPSLLEQLRALDAPVVDRSVCERVFGVRRRRAVELMHSFAGYQSGNTVLLDRLELIRQLEDLEASPEFAYERRRKARLAENLEKLQRYRAAASVQIPVLPVCEATLPDGVVLEHDRMIVEFTGVEQLLGRLYAVARVAAGNFEAFRTAVDASRGPDIANSMPT